MKKIALLVTLVASTAIPALSQPYKNLLKKNGALGAMETIASPKLPKTSSVANKWPTVAQQKVRQSFVENKVLQARKNLSVPQSKLTTTTPSNGLITDIPGVGKVHSYSDIPEIDYSLHVPSRRGHDHFVPMDLQRLTERVIKNIHQGDSAKQWEEMGGKMEYTSQKALAQELHRLYQGNGVRVVDPMGQEGIIYVLPVEGMVYAPIGRNAELLDPSHNVLIYYPQLNSGTLVTVSAEGLKFFKLQTTTLEGAQ